MIPCHGRSLLIFASAKVGKIFENKEFFALRIVKRGDFYRSGAIVTYSKDAEKSQSYSLSSYIMYFVQSR